MTRVGKRARLRRKVKHRSAALGKTFVVTFGLSGSTDGRAAIEIAVCTQDQAHRGDNWGSALVLCEVVEVGYVPFRVYPEQTSPTKGAVVNHLEAVQVTFRVSYQMAGVEMIPHLALGARRLGAWAEGEEDAVLARGIHFENGS